MFFIWKRFLKRLFPLFLFALLCLIYWSFIDPKPSRRVKPIRQIKKSEITPIEKSIDDNEIESIQNSSQTFQPKLQPIIPTISAKPDYKCKYKSSKYSDKDLTYVSPRLNKLLKRYIRLHDHQQSNFTAKESLSMPMTWGNNTSRFVVYSTGDEKISVFEKFYGLFTALMVAILVDRVLLIDDSSIEEAFCPPFKSNWIIDRDSVKILANQPEPEFNLIKKRIPVKSFTLHSDNQLLQCGGYLKQIFEPVQFILIPPKISNGLDLLRSNKAYEQSWTSEIFPDGLAINPLYNSLFNPTNELWEAYNAVIKEYLPPHKRLFKIMAFIGNPSDLERVKIIAEKLRENVNVFLYLASDERPDDLELKEIFPYPSYSVASAWHLFPRTSTTDSSSKDQWQRLVLDLQFTKSADILLLPEESIDKTLMLHAIRTKKTFKYNTKGKIIPLAPCDNYQIQQLACK
jgi:hypothetical protein